MRWILVLIAVLHLAGCSTIRDWWTGGRADPTPAQGTLQVPGQDSGAWVPLLPPAAPLRPAPYGGAGGQTEGLATVIQELDALARLVDIVSRMPTEPGEVTVNFNRIQADLAAVRAGLVEAVLRPRTAPRDWPALGGDYRE